MSNLGFSRTALPLSVASAIRYVALVYLGGGVGRNRKTGWGASQAAGRWLSGAALVLVPALVVVAYAAGGGGALKLT